MVFYSQIVHKPILFNVLLCVSNRNGLYWAHTKRAYFELVNVRTLKRILVRHRLFQIEHTSFALLAEYLQLDICVSRRARTITRFHYYFVIDQFASVNLGQIIELKKKTL